MSDIREIAEALEEISVLLELKGENPFKSRAYANAARVIRGTDLEVDEFIAQAAAGKIKGVGETISEKISILRKSGRLPYLEELRATFPAGLMELFKVPGLGAKKVKTLYAELGISSLGELEYACHENRLVELPGFGAKTQENILTGIKRLAAYAGRFRYSVARTAADRVVEDLRQSGLCIDLEIGGSIRRKLETAKDIDLLATSKKPKKLMDLFVKNPQAQQVVAHGETKSALVLNNGIAVDLRVVAPGEYASALLHFTGNKEHNTLLRALAKKSGLKLNEYGLFDGDKPLILKSEAEIYQCLGLHYIPPELREGRNEVDYAVGNEIPPLVELSDLQGIVHAHTNYSDATMTLRRLAETVRQLGYKYLGLTDHSQSAAYARGLKPADLKRQHDEVDRLNAELAPFKIFKGVESDILPDGSLDYPDDILAAFDFVIASVHSKFNMTEKDMTRRIIRAVQNRFTTILGHPTGRLLLSREAYPVNISEVLEAAAESKTAIELNANPHRLDLDWRYLPRAKNLGIPIAICPDAHSAEGLGDVEYGIGIARKGWLTKTDVLTCWDVKTVEAYFGKKRKK